MKLAKLINVRIVVRIHGHENKRKGRTGAPVSFTNFGSSRHNGGKRPKPYPLRADVLP
jgi:hypothetical protein